MTETVTMPLTMPDPCDCGTGSGNSTDTVHGDVVVVAPFDPYAGGSVRLVTLSTLPSISCSAYYYIANPVYTTVDDYTPCPDFSAGEFIDTTPVDFSFTGSVNHSGYQANINAEGGSVRIFRIPIPDDVPRTYREERRTEYPAGGSYFSPAITPCYHDVPCNFVASSFVTASLTAEVPNAIGAGRYVSEQLSPGVSRCYVNIDSSPNVHAGFSPGGVTAYQWASCTEVYRLKVVATSVQATITFGDLVESVDFDFMGDNINGYEPPQSDHCVDGSIYKVKDYDQDTYLRVSEALQHVAAAYKSAVERALTTSLRFPDLQLAHTVSVVVGGKSISISINIPEQDIDLA